MTGRLFVVGLAGVLVVAAGLRLAWLDGLPPGLAYDEAWEGIDAARIAAGARPVFLPENNGREPLFAYTAAPFVWLLGPTPLAVRATSATWGIAAVAAMAALGGAVGGRRLGLVAAGVMAVSYWPVHASRVGVRSVALTAVETLALALLLGALLWSRPRVDAGSDGPGAPAGTGADAAVGPRSDGPGGIPRLFGQLLAAGGAIAISRRGEWLAVAAGLAIGLSLYSYTPARLLVPLALLAVALRVGERIAHRDRAGARATVRTGALVMLTAGLVLTPLAAYFARHPAELFGRSDQVTVWNAIRTGADAGQILRENLALTLGAIGWRGDLQPRHNLPGRAILDPLQAALFLLGLVALLRSRGVVVAGTVLACFGLMLVPAWLSDSAPHQLRMTGAMAPIYLLVALGLDQVARAASRRIKGALVVAALVASGALTARDYFVEFAAPAVSRAPFDADVVEIAARLPQGPTLIGPIEPEHPALRFVAAEHETYRTFPLAALPLVVGPVDYFVRLPRGAAALANIRAAYPNAMVEWSDEVALARVAAGAAPIEPPPSRRLDAQFGAIWLLGVDARSARAGEELPLRLYWRAASPVDRRWTVFVHLVDETGRAWAHEDLEPGGGELPTRGWSPGEIVLDDRRVPLAPGIPPGDYRVRVGLVDEHGERGRLAGGAEYVEVGPVPIERGQGRANLWRLPMTRVEVDLSGDAGAVRLVGYRLERDRLEAGEALPLLLVWEPIGAATGLQAEVLVGPVRAPVASARGPVGGRRPVERWATNELLQEARAVALPPTLPAGRYEVAARLIGGNGKVVPLGAVSVESRARTFAAAQPQATVGVQFGGFAELTGYELAASPVAAGQRIQLRLYWRALATPVENYTVFLHLIDAGDRVRGQVDGTPAGGRAPTRTWLPGEMIVEERSFTVAADAAPGSYRLAAGLYLPSSGERAPITAGGTGDRAVFGQVEVAR